jgi:hypothetical protein
MKVKRLFYQAYAQLRQTVCAGRSATGVSQPNDGVRAADVCGLVFRAESDRGRLQASRSRRYEALATFKWLFRLNDHSASN